MSPFKKINLLTTALASFALVTSLMLNTAQASAEIATSASTSESIFYIQTSDHIVVTPGKLTLVKPEEKVLWFADAPSTGAGFYPINEYMKLWANPESYFSKNHPNATLIGYFVNPKTHLEQRLTLVVTLHSASLAKNKKSLTYQVTKTLLIPDNKSYNTKVTLYHTTLLIDDIPAGGTSPY
jgi:hypothetical protein